MPQDENPKRFDLEDRTYAFAKRCRIFVKTLTKTVGTLKMRDNWSVLRDPWVQTISKPTNR